ncbi:MAG: hypothetical protein QX199_12145 [Methylococcaceae bacterium]
MKIGDNRVIKVSGDKKHPTNFGRLCTKGNTCCATAQIFQTTISKDNGVPASVKADASTTDIKGLNMKQIDALTKLFGLDTASGIARDAHEQWYMQGCLTGDK